MTSVEEDVNRFMNDKLMPEIMTVCVTFLKGLTLPRNQTFLAVTCSNMIAFDQRTKKFNIEPPYLTYVMAKYVVTQILPFKDQINFALNVDVEEEQLSAIVNQFNGLMEKTYPNDFLSELKSDKCWPKQHPLKRMEQTTKRKRKGQEQNEFKAEEFTTKVSVQFIETTAVKVLLQTKRSLSEMLKVEALKSNNSSERFLWDQIKSLTGINNLNIAIPELNDEMQQLYRALMWLITAYTDWLGIDYIETPDLRAALGVMLSSKSKIIDDQTITEIIRPDPNLPAKFKNIVFDNIVMNNDLYISEPTMIRLGSALMTLSSAPAEDKKRILGLNGLFSKL
jgi:hypothetical protein